MSLHYLILWNQVDILQKHYKKDHVRMRLWTRFFGMRLVGDSFMWRYDHRLKASGTLADCLSLDSGRNATIQAFWEKATIGHILPIFDPVILNCVLFQYSSISSNLKIWALIISRSGKNAAEWLFSCIYCPGSTCGKKAFQKGQKCGVTAGLPRQIICQGAFIPWHKTTEVLAFVIWGQNK